MKDQLLPESHYKRSTVWKDELPHGAEGKHGAEEENNQILMATKGSCTTLNHKSRTLPAGLCSHRFTWICKSTGSVCSSNSQVQWLGAGPADMLLSPSMSSVCTDWFVNKAQGSAWLAPQRARRRVEHGSGSLEKQLDESLDWLAVSSSCTQESKGGGFLSYSNPTSQSILP